MQPSQGPWVAHYWSLTIALYAPLWAFALGVPHGESTGVRSVQSLSKFATHVSPSTAGQYGDSTCIEGGTA